MPTWLKRLARRCFLTFLTLSVTLAASACSPWTRSVQAPQAVEKRAADLRAKRGQPGAAPSAPPRQAVIYYATGDGRYLLPLTVEVGPGPSMPRVAVEKFLAGPPQGLAKSLLPVEMKLRDFWIDGDTAYVDLAGDPIAWAKKADPQSLKQALQGLVLTLTDFSGIHQVQLLVNGNSLPSLGGIDLKAPLGRPLWINPLPPTSGKALGGPVVRDQESEAAKGLWPGARSDRSVAEPGWVTVYYADSQLAYLVPVTVGIRAGEEPMKAAVEALLAGPPKGSGLLSPIQRDTRLLSLKVKNGLATVDLTRKALEYGGGSANELFLVNSLLLTLTDFPGVEQVQLLFGGQKVEVLPEGTNVGQPLSRPPLNPVSSLPAK